MAHPFDTTGAKSECPTCQQLLQAVYAASLKVHQFITLRWQDRALDKNYLHELGDLIYEQERTHSELVSHQSSHSVAAD
jgi:hypothetical protein